MASPVERVGWVRASDLARQVFCEYRVHVERVAGGDGRAGGRREPGLDAALGAMGVRRVELRGAVSGVPLVAMPYVVEADGGRRVYLRARLGTPRVRFDDRVYLAAVMLLALGEDAEPPGLAVAAASEPKGLLEAVAAVKKGRLGARGDGWIAARIAVDEAEAYRILEPLLDYWRGRRQPRPAASKRTCSLCPYRDSCPYSKASRENSIHPGDA